MSLSASLSMSQHKRSSVYAECCTKNAFSSKAFESVLCMKDKGHMYFAVLVALSLESNVANQSMVEA